MATRHDQTASQPTVLDERYRQLVRWLDDAFCIIEVLFDANQRPVDYVFLETNPAFVEQTGLVDAVGKRMRELRPSHEEHWFERYGRVALTGEPICFEAAAKALDRWFEVRAFRVDDPDAHRVALLFRDTAPTKAMQRDREELLAAERVARADAETAARAKSDFLAVMSHELRTPINAFVGYLQLIEMEIAGPITEQQTQYLQRMSMSATHLLMLIGDILDLAKVDAGELQVEREHAYTGTAVDAAIALTTPQAESRGITIADRQVGTNGVPYVGDEQRVRQILANLITNAVKFTDPGGIVYVACQMIDEGPPGARLAGGGPWAAVSVTDTGIGIAADDQQRVFDEFHQVDARRTRVQGGTGLGLAISRRLARLMGGDLTLVSEPGAGSVFTLWLPAGGGVRWGIGGAPETAEERGARAHRASAGFRIYSAADAGAYLRSNVDTLLERYVSRLRADPVVAPAAIGQSAAQLEDHMLSYLGDLCQTLLIGGEPANEASDLARDGSAIQRMVAELHGRQRQHLGFTERQLVREHEILHDELARMVKEYVPDDVGDISEANAVITRLLERAADTSVGAYRRAALATGRAKAE